MQHNSLCAQWGTDAAFFERPMSEPSCEELHVVKCILQAEIITTARSGAYSGTPCTVCTSTNDAHTLYLCRSTASAVLSRHIAHHYTAACGERVYRMWLWHGNPTIVNQARCKDTSNALDVGKIKYKSKDIPNHIIPLIPPIGEC